jgi:hypothetical protein
MRGDLSTGRRTKKAGQSVAGSSGGAWRHYQLFVFLLALLGAGFLAAAFLAAGLLAADLLPLVVAFFVAMSFPS